MLLGYDALEQSQTFCGPCCCHTVYFFPCLRPYTENLLDVYHACLLHKWPFFQITLFLFRRRPTFSVGRSPATAWCPVADQSCCGDMGSYGASQPSLQLTSDPDEIRKSRGEEEPTNSVKVPFGASFPHTAWTLMLFSLLCGHLRTGPFSREQRSG